MESSESTPAPAGLQDLQKFNLIKYPYNGRAPNLIDKFMIIGYDTKVLEKTLPLINEKYAPELAKQGIDSNPISVKSDERPTIINEVCFDYQKEVLDNEMVLELLFPDKPIFYLFKLPIAYPFKSNVTYLNPISLSLVYTFFIISSSKNLHISSLATSILAISPCILTLYCLKPKS